MQPDKFVESKTNLKLENQNEDYSIFWFSEPSSKGPKWKIDHLKLTRFIYSRGYRRFDIGKDYLFVLIENMIIEEIPVHLIQDAVISYINSIPRIEEEKGKDILKEINLEELLSKFYTSPAIYFNDRKLSMLGVEPDLQLNADTKEYCYIYYKNGFVKCSAKEYKLYSYRKLKKHIFKKQKKDREFKKHTPEGMFSKFISNIAGKDEQRFLSLQTTIGYLLHGYFETKMKAVNLTDSSISDVAEGRTGKSLLGKAISKIKNVCEISGKDFDPSNKHKYATAGVDTQIIFLNDLRKKFNFENLFNDISEAITIDRKNLQPFQIQTKMLIAANDTFRIEGASAKDRVIEFELSEHYNAEYSPKDEFGCWFFNEWDDNEWNAFDNFMMGCISKYLKLGVVEAASINLDKRKQIQHTNHDFVEYMDEKIRDEEIRNGRDYDKKELHEDFLGKYPEYKEDRWLKRTANFTRYLKTYANYSTQLGKPKERRTNGGSLIKFTKNEDETQMLPF